MATISSVHSSDCVTEGHPDLRRAADRSGGQGGAGRRLRVARGDGAGVARTRESASFRRSAGFLERDDWHEEPPEPVRDGCPLPGLGALRASRLNDAYARLRASGLAVPPRQRVSAYSGTPVVACPSGPVIATGGAAAFGTTQAKKKSSKPRSCPCTLSIRLSNRFTRRSSALNGSVADALVARPTPRTPTHSATVRTVRFIAIPSFRLLSTPIDPCTIMPCGRGREQTEKDSGIRERPHIPPRYLW